MSENSWPLKVLLSAAGVMLAALLAFLVTIASAQSGIKQDQASMRVSIGNIEHNIEVITAARSIESEEQRRINSQRIRELEALEKIRDRETQ